MKLLRCFIHHCPGLLNDEFFFKIVTANNKILHTSENKKLRNLINHIHVWEDYIPHMKIYYTNDAYSSRCELKLPAYGISEL